LEIQIPAIQDSGVADPILILDNCRIHHSVEAKALLLANGIDFIFLPPYSPEFNPIEEAFSKFKSFIRRDAHIFELAGFNDFYVVNRAMEQINAQDAMGWIIHAGY
jgi:hypothetical protein